MNTFLSACRGIVSLCKIEKNFRIHIFCSSLVIILGLIFSVSFVDWCILFVVIGNVLILEGINAALEALADVLYPRFDPHVGRIKDMMAGCVLISACMALVVGCLIFIPKIIVAF